MKKFILLFALLLPVFSNAQTAAKDSAVVYSCSLYDAQFVAGTLPEGSDIIDAIAFATVGAADSADIVQVTVTQGDLVTVAQNNRLLHEGVAAEVNARLFANVIGLLAGRPWLAVQMMAVKATNQHEAGRVVDNGQDRIERKRAAYNRQQ